MRATCHRLLRSWCFRSMSYTTTPVGQDGTLEYRLFFEKDGKRISPWHDIPLYADKDKHICNYVCEIPRHTNGKLEIAVAEELNPIKQDVKNGKLRFVADIMNQKGYPFNYGAFPQTWEDPSFVDPHTNAKGDKDPVDVVEIGSRIANRGDVRQVKILGTLCLIDEGETDWKFICIDTADPEAEKLNDIDDVRKSKPGLIELIHDWFRDYKIPDGKAPNVFAFDGAAKDRAFAQEVLDSQEGFWRNKYAK